MKDKASIYSYVAVVSLIFSISLISCKDVVKEKVKQISDEIDKEIAQISVEGVDEVVSAASSVRSAISAVGAAKSVKGNILTGRITKGRMITGRMVTARSPKIYPSFLGISEDREYSGVSQKKIANRLSPKISLKTSDFGSYSCNEYTDLNGNTYLELFIGDSAYFLLYQQNSYSLGITVEFTQGSTSAYIEGIFSSCDPSLFPLVCPTTEDDFLLFLDSISSYCADIERISADSYSDTLTLNCYSDASAGNLLISFSGYNFSFYADIMYDGTVQVDTCSDGNCYSEVLTCDLSMLPDFLVECDIINYSPDYFSSEALNFAMSCLSGDGAYPIGDTPSEFCYADQTGGYMYLYTGDSDVYLYTAYMDDGNTYLMKELCSGNDLDYSCDIYIGGVPFGTPECNPSFSCEYISTLTDVSEFISSLDSCSFELQGKNQGGVDGGKSCFSDDFDGDGNPDTSVFTSYQKVTTGDMWETISVQNLEDGTITTIKEVCTYFEQNGGYTQSCTIYSTDGSCEIDTSLCEYTCTGSFKESGFYRDELEQSGVFSSSACFSLEDIDGDGRTETTWYLASQNSFKAYALLGRTTLLYSVCEFSDANTNYFLGYDVEGNVSCEIFRANCKAPPSCSDDISEFLKGCESKSLRTCSGQVECESIFLSIAVELNDKISQLEEISVIDEGGGKDTPERATGPVELECSITTNPQTGEFISIRKTPEGYEFSKGTTRQFFVYICPESSQVDFEACSISGCDIPDERAEDVAEKVAQISDYVETATYISFSLKVSGQVSGIIDVIYDKKEKTYDLSGELTLKDGGKLNFSATVYEDGVAEIEFVLMKPEGDEIQGKFTVKQDGSSEGTIKVGDKTYIVNLSADGKGNVCDSAGKCIEIS